MADIAAANLTYTVTKRSKLEDSRWMTNATVAFGDGALTYPAGGVPLTKASLGCPNTIDSLFIEDIGGSGYVYQYDKANEKLRLFQSPALANHSHSVPAHTHDLFLNDADVVDGATTRINAGTGLLGANTGSDITVAGVTDTSGHGGIVQAAAGTSGNAAYAAAGLAEVTGVAVAAQTVKVTVIGW